MLVKKTEKIASLLSSLEFLPIFYWIEVLKSRAWNGRNYTKRGYHFIPSQWMRKRNQPTKNEGNLEMSCSFMNKFFYMNMKGELAPSVPAMTIDNI